MLIRRHKWRNFPARYVLESDDCLPGMTSTKCPCTLRNGQKPAFPPKAGFSGIPGDSGGPSLPSGSVLARSEKVVRMTTFVTFDPRIHARIEKRDLFDTFLRKWQKASKSNGEILTFWPFARKSQIESGYAVNSPLFDSKVLKTCRFPSAAGRKVTISANRPELPDSGGPTLQSV